MPTPVQRGLASRSHLPLVLGTNRSDPVAVRLEPLLAGRLPLGHGPGAWIAQWRPGPPPVRKANAAEKQAGGGRNQRTSRKTRQSAREEWSSCWFARGRVTLVRESAHFIPTDEASLAAKGRRPRPTPRQPRERGRPSSRICDGNASEWQVFRASRATGQFLCGGGLAALAGSAGWARIFSAPACLKIRSGHSLPPQDGRQRAIHRVPEICSGRILLDRSVLRRLPAQW